jgi:DNA-directed RNA polymerase
MSMQYEGGYFLINEPLVRSGGYNAHTALDHSGLSDYSVDAVNHVQNTPWQVNKFTLGFVQSMRDSGRNIYNDGLFVPPLHKAPLEEDIEGVLKREEDVVLRFERPLDPKIFLPSTPKEIWATFTDDEKATKKTLTAEVFDAYAVMTSEVSATRRIVKLAVDMAKQDHFYFPHNMDFRLRIYPIPTDLTPQANDLAKGLLKFRKGMRLGPEGYYWLGVSVASQWGEDKLHPDERLQYAKDMLTNSDIQRWVDDPLKYRGWLKADSPFQFMAAAHEWVWANRMADPEAFMSYVPVNLDGTCNGAQHLSIMARDLVGAKATNCTSEKKRNDLYMEVANRVYEQVKADAGSNTNPEIGVIAAAFLPKLEKPSDRRKVVKRSVMTVPYGVSGYGIANFMVKDKVVKKKEWEHAKYIRDAILEAIDGMMGSGRMLQVWFSECATICAEAGLPLSWDTPAGSKVTQAYRNLIESRVTTINTRFVIYKEPNADENSEDFMIRLGMDVKKSAKAAPPNVVHSCDAAHLQITTCRMAQMGITSFSMIHDSFGCHAAHVGLMRDILRESIVHMYEDNYLMRFKASVEKYSGLTMPAPPPLGEYDLQELLKSDFFFS